MNQTSENDIRYLEHHPLDVIEMDLEVVGVDELFSALLLKTCQEKQEIWNVL